jgi:hypothetical protein
MALTSVAAGRAGMPWHGPEIADRGEASSRSGHATRPPSALPQGWALAAGALATSTACPRGWRRRGDGEAGGRRKARPPAALAGAPAATKFLSPRGKECMMIAGEVVEPKA